MTIETRLLGRTGRFVGVKQRVCIQVIEDSTFCDFGGNGYRASKGSSEHEGPGEPAESREVFVHCPCLGYFENDALCQIVREMLAM